MSNENENDFSSVTEQNKSIGEALGQEQEAPVALTTENSQSNSMSNSSPAANNTAVVAATAAPTEGTKTKKPMTEGQKKLQEERLKTLDMMREAYKAKYGDGKGAPKAKAYNAAGLTTVRLDMKDDQAFKESLPMLIEELENKHKAPKNGTAKGKTVKSKAKVASASTVAALAANVVPAATVAANTKATTKKATTKKAASKSMVNLVTAGKSAANLRAMIAKLEAEAAAAENAEKRAAEARAAENARKKAEEEMKERASKNLRNALGGQNAPSHVVSGFMKLLTSEYKNSISAKQFMDICSLCSAGKTKKAKTAAAAANGSATRKNASK